MRFQHRWNAETRTAFLDGLSGVIEAADFTIIAVVIDKQRHIERYAQPIDPYKIALRFCLERLQYSLSEHGQVDHWTHVQVERRGTPRMPTGIGISPDLRRPQSLGKMQNLDIVSWIRSTMRRGCRCDSTGRASYRPPRDKSRSSKPSFRHPGSQVPARAIRSCHGVRITDIPDKSERPLCSPRAPAPTEHSRSICRNIGGEA